MEKRTVRTADGQQQRGESQAPRKSGRKLTEYGRQLQEKQKVKEMYGVREKQFRRFFALAVKSQEATGHMLLSFLERRLDNVVFRLKMTITRAQARQLVVHGHIYVNGKKVNSPSYIVKKDETISIAPRFVDSTFVSGVMDKKLAGSSRVPEWLELVKKERVGRVLRDPVRTDIQAPIEEHLIIELYSK